MRKIKLVKAANGLQTPAFATKNASGFSAGNKQFNYPVYPAQFAKPLLGVKKTIQPVDREDANLEAEKGEHVIMDADNTGMPTNFKIAGKRHSEGGTPLNLPPESFIFSRDKKMKIKDPLILKQFGMGGTGSGYTPAEIAKKYDVNEFRKVLADPNSDKMQKKTAELMISNYMEKLAKLALVQESIKGFPQGIPSIALPYMQANNFNPADIFSVQGDEAEPDQEQARYGMNVIPEMYRDKLMQFGGGAGISSYDKAIPMFPIGGIGPTTPESVGIGDQPKKVEQVPEGFQHLKTEGSREYYQVKGKTIDPAKPNTTQTSDPNSYFETMKKQVMEGVSPDDLVSKGYITKDNASKLSPFYKQKTVYVDKPQNAVPAAPATNPANYNPATSRVSTFQQVHTNNDPNFHTYKIPNLNGQDNKSEVRYFHPKTGQELDMDLMAKNKGNIDASVYTDSNRTLDYYRNVSNRGTGNSTMLPNNPNSNTVVTATPATNGTTKINASQGFKFGGEQDPENNKGQIHIQYLPNKKEGGESNFQLPKLAGGGPPDGTPTYDAGERAVLKKIFPNAVLPEDIVESKQQKSGVGYGRFDKKQADKNWAWYGKPIDWENKEEVNNAQNAYNKRLYDKIMAAKHDPDFANKVVKRIGFDPDSSGPNKLDSLAGKYTETRVDLDVPPPEKVADAVAAAPTERGAPPIKPNALKVPQQQEDPAKVWLQDIVKTAGAFGDRYRINKYLPWQATFNPVTVDPTFYDPTRELAANSEQANIASTAVGMFSGPQALNSRLTEIQGQGAKNAADILGRYNNENVTVANQFEGINANILNNANEIKGQQATNLYDKTTIANQQFDNSKAMARQNLRQSFISAITNRAQTQALNSMYPQYQVDPSSGGLVHFTKGKKLSPNSGKPTDVMDVAQDYLKKYPSFTPQQAFEAAKVSMGVHSTPNPQDEWMKNYQATSAAAGQ